MTLLMQTSYFIRKYEYLMGAPKFIIGIFTVIWFHDFLIPSTTQ